jgi:xylulokinase
MGIMLDIVRTTGQPVSKVRLSGAGNQSLFWRQLQADIYGCPVETTNSEEGGCALGAAILAMVGSGAYRDVDHACATCIRVVERLEPDESALTLQNHRKRKFAHLYPALRSFTQS